MKLSFIVPVNKPDSKMLEKCLRSLKKQSLKDFEVIVVLDGPHDGLVSKISKMLGKVEHRVIEKEHGGANCARNSGAEKAKGDILCFWDCDCVIEPDAAKMWMDKFEQDEDIGFIYSGYRFDDETGAIPSESFDPWMLKIRNYISTCFPVRRKFYPGWDESLKSAQDWDFWLSVVEKGAKGHYVPGYAFSTSAPSQDSISGEGCSPENWLERQAIVKKKHNLPNRDICVTSIDYRNEGIRLAKMIDADYIDYPHAKPHEYKTMIQVGFGFQQGKIEHHSAIFNKKGMRKILFWTGDNVLEGYNAVSCRALFGDDYMKGYVELLNLGVEQFCEDTAAKNKLDRMGFKVKVMPMPLEMSVEVTPLPEKPKFGVDIQEAYGHIFASIEKSLPDVELEIVGKDSVDNYTGLIHFFTDRSMSQSIKRMIVSGRHVISNVQAPGAGYLDDRQKPDTFIPAIVEKVRGMIGNKPDDGARDYFLKTVSKEGLLEVLS
jgi:glycosyltransferase involved in cell wall biosynthesis